MKLLLSLFIIYGMSNAIAQQSELNGRAILLAKIEHKQNSQDLFQNARLNGRDRALLCSYCHGNDGNSLKDTIPNLAGQNPTYLLEQISKFASGERKEFVMNSLARDLSEDDQVNLAIFYSSQSVKRTVTDPAFVAKGKWIYVRACQSCHGADGRGESGYARLAGQKTDYLKMTLTRYRDNTRHRQITGVKRSNPVMDSVTKGLSDTEIQYLATYITSLR